MSDLVGNPEDRFSRNMDNLSPTMMLSVIKSTKVGFVEENVND